jgi:hypothetical protein
VCSSLQGLFGPRWAKSKDANLHVWCRSTFGKFAGSWGVGLKQKMIQKMIGIDLASQANSALLQTSQQTNRRLK